MKPYFAKTGFIAREVLNITPAEAFRLSEKNAIIVDVREEYLTNFRLLRVKNVLYLPFSKLPSTFQQLPGDIPLIFADAVGLKGHEAVKFMMEHGYENVANLAGGIVDWERDGLPVTTDKSYRLSGSCMCQLKGKQNLK